VKAAARWARVGAHPDTPYRGLAGPYLHIFGAHRYQQAQRVLSAAVNAAADKAVRGPVPDEHPDRGRL
jgi:hypothetical protein